MKNLFKKIGALLVAAVMVLSMCTAVFADKVTNQYADKITVTNLAADVATTLNVYNIIYLDVDAAGNQTWKVVDWAKDYIEEANGEFTIKNSEALKMRQMLKKKQTILQQNLEQDMNLLTFQSVHMLFVHLTQKVLIVLW